MRLVRLGAPSRIYPVRTDRGLPEKMVFGLAPPACMLQAILSQIKAVGPSQSGGKAPIMGQIRRDHQMTSAATKDDSIYHSGRGHRRREGQNTACTHARFKREHAGYGTPRQNVTSEHVSLSWHERRWCGSVTRPGGRRKSTAGFGRPVPCYDRW